MPIKSDLRVRTFRESLLLAIVASAVTAAVLSYIDASNDLPSNTDPEVLRQLEALRQTLEEAKRQSVRQQVMVGQGPSGQKGLLFYNRPGKTGSTSVRIAMKKALEDAGMVAAKCFNMIEWNEMALRTIIKRRDVDFYGCHTRLFKDRYNDVASLRGGNVTFMTSTREPSKIVFSSYLQHNRNRNVAAITDKAEMEAEIKRYREYVSSYPVDALYRFHGAEVPLTKCPYSFQHENAMRKIAERYEIVIDLERPKESAALVEIVTGLKPDFDLRYNERSMDLSSPMLKALSEIDTSSRSCGNELVHKVLMQQFNVIKDRLMQNRCFNEDDGTYALCDKVVLDKSLTAEKSRRESFKERKRLLMG